MLNIRSSKMKLFFYIILCILFTSCLSNGSEKVNLTIPIKNKVLSKKALTHFFAKDEITLSSPKDDKYQSLDFNTNDSTGIINMIKTGLRGGDFFHPEASFRIVLIDKNANGRYNDPFVDQISIVPVGQDSILTNYVPNSTTVKDYVSVVTPSQNFKIQLDKTDGSYVTVHPVNLMEKVEKNPIYFYNKMLGITVNDKEGKPVLLTGQIAKNKLNYVYWYSPDCRKCITQMPMVKRLIDKYPRTLNFIGLVPYSVDIKSFSKKYKFINTYALSSPAQEALFEFIYLPDGNLYNKNGVLLQAHIHLKNLELYLENRIDITPVSYDK